LHRYGPKGIRRDPTSVEAKCVGPNRKSDRRGRGRQKKLKDGGV